MELKYIVYITINLCNGKFYIGVHKTNPNVFDGYIGNSIYKQNDAKKNFVLHKAVRKYGYNNFKRTIIQTFPDTEEGRKQAYELEAKIVNTTLLKSKNVYNTAIGGLGSCVESSLKKVYMYDLKGNYLRSFKSCRDAALFVDPENIENAKNAIKNNCLKTSKTALGYFWSYNKEFLKENNIKWKKVAQYTLSGKFIRYFDSLTEAEEMLHLNSIDQAITKNYQCGGYQWKYFTGECNDVSPLINNKTKFDTLKIQLLDLNGNLIKNYDSINQCVKDYPQFDKSQIMRVLKKIIKSHKGYCFKLKDEDIV